MTEYKPKTESIMLNMILSVLFTVIVVFFARKEDSLLLIISVLLVYYIISLFFFKKRVTAIIIDDVSKTIIITYRRFGLARKNVEYQLDGVIATYKTETSPRVIKRRELRLYDIEENLIVKIIPTYEGWSVNDM